MIWLWPELGHFWWIYISGVSIEVCHMVPGTKFYLFLHRHTLNYRVHLGLQSAPKFQYAYPMQQGLNMTQKYVKWAYIKCLIVLNVVVHR